MSIMRRAFGQQNLLTRNPRLAREWHPTKNGDLSPKDVTSRSARKVWWQCEKGHAWEAQVGNRFMGTGCPYCAGKRPTQETSLASRYPQLVREWHPEKNKNLSPNNFSHGSHTKVWWACSRDNRHEWQAMILHRARKKSGCPYCSGHKPSSTDNFRISAPNLAKEFDLERNYPLAPEELRPNSARKVWWICPKNKTEHRWLAVVSGRINGNGCPYCRGRRVCESNSLQTLRLDLAKQWHPTKNGALTPENVVAGGHRKVWWQCKYGHEWQAPIGKRLKQTWPCPKCTLRTSLMELRVYSELKIIFEKVELQKIKHGVECDVYLPGIKLAIEVDGYFYHRQKQRKDENKNLVLEKHGISVMRLRENLPRIREHDVECKYSDKHFDVINRLLKSILELKVCSSNEESLINDYLIGRRLKNDEGFKQLWNRFPAPALGASILETHKTLAQEWIESKNGRLTPADVTHGSSRIIWWQCKRGHEYKARVARRCAGDGCPYCSGQKVCKDNCLATKQPTLAKEWHPTKNGDLTPQDVTPGSSKMKVWWRCEKGHEWEMRPLARSHGQNCPFCVGKKASKDNCLATMNPRLAKEWHPIRNGDTYPNDVTPGSGKKFWWECKKGHAFQMRILARSHGSNCPYCIGRRAGSDNCLAVVNPGLSREWHPTKNGALTPRDVTRGSKKKAWWQCKKGHEWEAFVKARTNGTGCPDCKKRGHGRAKGSDEKQLELF